MVHSVKKAVVETKVKAATVVGGATLLALQLLLAYVPGLRDLDQDALGQVLEWVIVTVGGALGAFIGGWRSRHTFRPDLGEVPPSTEPPVSTV